MLNSGIRGPYTGDSLYALVMMSYACALSFSWGILGLMDASTFGSTPLNVMHQLTGDHITAALLYIGATFTTMTALAFVKHPMARLGMMLPLQGVLVIAAAGSIQAIIVGHFVDGNIRSRFLIAADQAPIILMAIAYTAAIMIAVLKSRRPLPA